mgnify:CR=1 FL=1
MENDKKTPLRVLDLFSGIGGFSYALERLCPEGAFRTIAFCEQDKFCQSVLRKHWPDTPIFDDVRTIPTNGLGKIDVVVGGFPCQPWSVAGEQRGAEDDRDFWPEMARLIGEIQPAFVVGENVRGFVNQPMGLQRSLSDLARIGYQAVPFVIPACAVDAPHRRDRVWIVAAKNDTDSDSERPHRKNVNKQREDEPADGEERVVGQVRSVLARSGDASERRSASVIAHRESDGREQGKQNSGGRREGIGAGEEYRSGNGGETVADARRNATRASEEMDGNTHKRSQGNFDAANGSKDVADADDARSQGHGRFNNGRDSAGEWIAGQSSESEPRTWLTEPDVGRVAHGVPNRVDRLRSLGNAVVAAVVAQIGKAILSAVDE